MYCTMKNPQFKHTRVRNERKQHIQMKIENLTPSVFMIFVLLTVAIPQLNNE